jgi:hypothetical protein
LLLAGARLVGCRDPAVQRGPLSQLNSPCSAPGNALFLLRRVL